MISVAKHQEPNPPNPESKMLQALATPNLNPACAAGQACSNRSASCVLALSERQRLVRKGKQNVHMTKQRNDKLCRVNSGF